MSSLLWFLFFFFQAEDGIRDVAVTGVQTCALPISIGGPLVLQRYSPRQAVCLRRRNWLESRGPPQSGRIRSTRALRLGLQDRKSTRLNSSHGYISYAVFCLKKKKKINKIT